MGALGDLVGLELVAVLQRLEPLPHQRLGALQVHLGEVEVGLRLADVGLGLQQRGIDLAQGGHRLFELLVEVRRRDVDEEVALLHPRPDVDPPLGDVAGGTGEDGGGGEGLGFAGQRQVDGAVLGLGRDGADLRHRMGLPVLRRRGGGVLLPMAVDPPGEGEGQHQDDAGEDPARRHAGRGVRGLAGIPFGGRRGFRRQGQDVVVGGVVVGPPGRHLVHQR